MLGDLTGDRDPARLVSAAAGRLQDLVMTVDPAADGIILSSRGRLLRELRAASLGRRRRGPGGGAPPRRPGLHGPRGLWSRFRQH